MAEAAVISFDREAPLREENWPMRIVVIDSKSLTGHMICQYLLERNRHELYSTTKDPGRSPNRLYLDPLDSLMVEKLLQSLRPDVVINCSGIVYDEARQHEVDAYRVNGLLPHQLAELASRLGFKLIHLSTDSVFDGERGSYEERHVPNGSSVYGRTKALGELIQPPSLTVRTSLLGPAAEGREEGLLNWFLHRKGTARGFASVLWNGITTLELAKFISYVIDNAIELGGIVHLTASQTISKHDLLLLLQDVFEQRDISIHADDSVVLKRTLASTRPDVRYPTPSHIEMITELRDWMIKYEMQGR
ncbi:dTDP-4-dehydrorhamnose reductase family protein [Paenibacillus allorhizosphaerae]|uniref:dTDP-4-dehydrorhamnose reductase n=1 Tax=Paenibacillus allorhizosphaerae TaxID=2849866 RepID=A0ABM8VL03_9BACL|nr:SDR family oxidoreductase [Paenibacillus allorhizosphaerae]CAG7647739.1 hypothetical protein PAECIP111802_04052 [Paenibacillus allorhizosphaerae]